MEAKANNSANGSSPDNSSKPKQRELKFYLHDSNQRKTSESYNKIVDTIITKIQRTFDDSLDIVSSIENKAKMV